MILITGLKGFARELRHLRYFAAVAEDLSFRRAARRLFVSEAAVSQQIGGLEDELGVKLFNRNSRRVELTEVGRVFLVGARRTLVSAQEAVVQAKAVTSEPIRKDELIQHFLTNAAKPATCRGAELVSTWTVLG